MPTAVPPRKSPYLRPGIKIGRNLPKAGAKRTLCHPPLDEHQGGRSRPATFRLRHRATPGGPITYPSLGALISKELERPGAEMPGFISIATNRGLNAEAFGSGFLGPQYAPCWSAKRQLQPAAARTGPRPVTQGTEHRASSDVVVGRPMPGFVSWRRSKRTSQGASGSASQGHLTAYQRAVP